MHGSDKISPMVPKKLIKLEKQTQQQAAKLIQGPEHFYSDTTRPQKYIPSKFHENRPSGFIDDAMQFQDNCLQM